MKIKIGDYIKLKDDTDWERVSCILDYGFFETEGMVLPLDIDNITEVLPYGELVDVSLCNKIWEKRIFIAYDKGFTFPFRCIADDGVTDFKDKEQIDTMSWSYARQIPAKVKITWENKEKWISKEAAKALFEEDKS